MKLPTPHKLRDLLMTKPRVVESPVPPSDLLSTGSTMLDLAMTGRVRGGLVKGHYYFFVGDSSSGKTWLSLSCFAEAARNKNFEGYRLIYDNGEDGAMMNMRHYFGDAMADRLEPPRGTREDPQYSSSIEDMYDNLHTVLAPGAPPCIYVQDSMDVLTSEPETEKYEEQRKARAKGKDTKGSYGDGKAKYNSASLRQILPMLKRNKSILVILCQTRDNIGQGPFTFEKKTRSGGRALKFYATVEIWTSVAEKIRKTVRGKPRVIGMVAEVKVKKNRTTGRDVAVKVPIYLSHGIDDIGGCVDYLVEEGHWKGEKSINAPEFNFTGQVSKLIRHIEDEGLERELKLLVQRVWREIEEECTVQRKRRYE
jgi:RecA/RadA recombinase